VSVYTHILQYYFVLVTLKIRPNQVNTVKYGNYAQIKFSGLHRNKNVLYISHTASEHCSYIFGQQPLNKWKYRINVPISGMKKQGTIPVFGQNMTFLQILEQTNIEWNSVNLDVYRYKAHSDGLKIHYAHGILSLYWLNWCCKTQTLSKECYSLYLYLRLFLVY
jgi:hypothetical protein